MIEIVITKKRRLTPLGSNKANVLNPVRTLFIYMIEMFITEKCRPTHQGPKRSTLKID